METASKKSLFGTSLREWTQFGILLFATGFGVYQFHFKEILAPKSAPINISMTLEARQVGASRQTSRRPRPRLIAIEVKVSAKNPSSRNIYLLKSLWVAYGSTVGLREAPDDSDFSEELTSAVNSTGLVQSERHADTSDSITIASGGIFTDEVLRPGESLMRTIVFFVPEGEYDVVDVSTQVPSVTVEGIVNDWRLQKDANWEIFLFKTEGGTDRKEIPRNNAGNYQDAGVEFQTASSQSRISLWR